MTDLDLAIARVNAWLAPRYSPLTSDQLLALRDPQRLGECLDMIDHLQDRCGLPDGERGDIVAALLDAAIDAGVEGIES